MTRYIGITGLKKVGKTTTIEHLVPQLKKRKVRVGTVKVAFKPVSIDVDKNHYDVQRLRKGVPDKTMFKSTIETTIFFNEKMELKSALEKFSNNLDIVLIEGFTKDLLGLPQIALVKDTKEENEVINDFTVAISSIPEFKIKSNNKKYVEFDKLVEIVEKEAQPLLPGLDCKHCGFNSCNELMKHIIKGDKKAQNCYVIESSNQEVSLKVNNQVVPCNPFVQKVFKNVIVGIVESIKINDKEFSEIEVQVRFTEKDRRER